MTELLRERFVDRQDKTRKKFGGFTNDPIRVSFYDLDGTRVNDVTRKEANKIAAANPSQLFYFQDKNAAQRELNIGQVNGLNPGSDLKKSPSCNTAAKPCGLPVLNIFGGEGLGALANTIVSPISSGVIGFDIINGGKNYTTPPFAQLIDVCGKGSGNKLETEISGGSVTRIKIKTPGDGYLASPDGSFGGGGRTIKSPQQGLVQKPDGTYQVTPPNVIPELEPGDVFIPPTLPPTTLPPTTITPTPPQTPILGPTYPVVLEIEDIDIDNPGFGYQPGDKIIVTPDRGAVLEPVIDNGRIIKINVIQPGIGFDDFPIITTNSPTGYNLSARPIFKVRRLDEEESFIPPPGASIISVVDCVGIVPPKKEFDRVPR
jgi:hypothetical protein